MSLVSLALSGLLVAQAAPSGNSVDLTETRVLACVFWAGLDRTPPRDQSDWWMVGFAYEMDGMIDPAPEEVEIFDGSDIFGGDRVSRIDHNFFKIKTIRFDGPVSVRKLDFVPHLHSENFSVTLNAMGLAGEWAPYGRGLCEPQEHQVSPKEIIMQFESESRQAQQ